MNIKLISVISLATATLTVAVPSFSQSVSFSSKNKPSFSCQNIFKPASKKLIFVALDKIPERSDNVSTFYWESEYSSQIDWNERVSLRKLKNTIENGRNTFSCMPKLIYVSLKKFLLDTSLNEQNAQTSLD